MVEETTMPPSEAPELLSIRRLLESAGAELERRLAEGKLDNIPSATLIRFFLDGQKALAARSVPDGDENEDEEIDVISKLDVLPVEYAREIVAREIVRIDLERKEWLSALSRMEKKK